MLALLGGRVIVGAAVREFALRSARRVRRCWRRSPLAVHHDRRHPAPSAAQKLSIFNLFGLLLVVAVGSNYCLFFERRRPSGETAKRRRLARPGEPVHGDRLRRRSRFSHIPVLYGIGGTVAIGALLSLVFAAILTRPATSGRSFGHDVDPRRRHGRRERTHPLLALPGAGMQPEDFTTAGFDRLLLDRRLPVDLLAADIDSGLYLDNVGSLLRIHAEFVLPARQRGYRRIWLLAISLGGMGALAVHVRAYPGEIEGAILIAPFLGTRGLIAEVARDGGSGRHGGRDR